MCHPPRIADAFHGDRRVRDGLAGVGGQGTALDDRRRLEGDGYLLALGKAVAVSSRCADPAGQSGGRGRSARPSRSRPIPERTSRPWSSVLTGPGQARSPSGGSEFASCETPSQVPLAVTRPMLWTRTATPAAGMPLMSTSLPADDLFGSEPDVAPRLLGVGVELGPAEAEAGSGGRRRSRRRSGSTRSAGHPAGSGPRHRSRRGRATRREPSRASATGSGADRPMISTATPADGLPSGRARGRPRTSGPGLASACADLASRRSVVAGPPGFSRVRPSSPSE